MRVSVACGWHALPPPQQARAAAATPPPELAPGDALVGSTARAASRRRRPRTRCPAACAYARAPPVDGHRAKKQFSHTLDPTRVRGRGLAAAGPPRAPRRQELDTARLGARPRERGVHDVRAPVLRHGLRCVQRERIAAPTRGRGGRSQRARQAIDVVQPAGPGRQRSGVHCAMRGAAQCRERVEANVRQTRAPGRWPPASRGPQPPARVVVLSFPGCWCACTRAHGRRGARAV